MLGITPLILIVLPLLFQIIFGTISIFKNYSFKFKTVFITNIVLQFVFAITSYCIASYNFSKYFEQHPNSPRCGMPFVGLIGLTFISTLILFVVIVIQYFIKRWKENNDLKN